MEGGQAETDQASVDVSLPTPAADDTVELKPADSLNVCPRCLVSNGASDHFCTACGAPLPEPLSREHAPPGAVGSNGTLYEQAAVAATAGTADSSPAVAEVRGSWRGRIVAGIAAVAIAAMAAFALLWHNESAHARRVQHSLAATRISLASTQASLTRTRGQLNATTAVANKRRAVLLQAQKVLLKVDPLLSSVDDLQTKAGSVQGDSGVLVSDAESLIQTTVALVNYLVGTNTAYVNYSYVDGLIGSANSELDSVRADESILGGADNVYGKASTDFGNRANGFSASVRSLQKELKGVTGK